MSHHSCLLCLGSNYERHIHMEVARKALEQHFPNIRFGEEMETEAIGEKFFSPFSNQLAKFETNLDFDSIRCILKEIEHLNGRMLEDKSQGIVKLDIDILIYDSQIIKEQDLKRDFIRKGLKSFGMAIPQL